jgi:serine/threonine protein kinase
MSAEESSRQTGPASSVSSRSAEDSHSPSKPVSVPSFSYGKPIRSSSDRIGRRSPVRTASALRHLPHPPLPALPPALVATQQQVPSPSTEVGAAADLIVCVQSVSGNFSGQFSGPSQPSSMSHRFSGPASPAFSVHGAEAETIEKLRRDYEALMSSLLVTPRASDGSDLHLEEMPRAALVNLCRKLQKMVQDAVSNTSSQTNFFHLHDPPMITSALTSRAPSFHREQVRSSEAMISRTGSMASVASFRPNVRSTGHVLRSIDDETGRKKINQFVVLSELGRGSQAKVKLVFDCNTGELRAMKVIRRPSSFTDMPGSMRDSGAIARIEREVKIWRSLRHRNLVRLHEVIDDHKASKLYLVMEYISGGPITKMRGTFCDRIDPKAFGELSRQLTAAISYLHHRNVVHRDIKPDNCMVDGQGFVHLVDFGVSELLDPEGDAMKSGGLVGGMQGTPAYMPPEMLVTQNTNASPNVPKSASFEASPMGTLSVESSFSGGPRAPSSVHIDGFAADVWSLGITLFSCLVGRLPFVVVRDASVPPEERYAFSLPMYYRAVIEESPSFPPHPVLAQQREETKRIFAFEEPMEALAPEWESLIRAMLNKDPTKRPSIRQVHNTIKSTASFKPSGSGRRFLSMQVTGERRRSHTFEDDKLLHEGITSVEHGDGPTDDFELGEILSYHTSVAPSPAMSMTSLPLAAKPNRRITTAYDEREHQPGGDENSSSARSTTGLCEVQETTVAEAVTS